MTDVLNWIMSIASWIILVLSVTGFLAIVAGIVWIIWSEWKDDRRK